MTQRLLEMSPNGRGLTWSMFNIRKTMGLGIVTCATCKAMSGHFGT